MPPEAASLRQRPVKALGSEAKNLGGTPWTEEYRVTIETEISNIEALVLLFKVSKLLCSSFELVSRVVNIQRPAILVTRS